MEILSYRSNIDLTEKKTDIDPSLPRRSPVADTAGSKSSFNHQYTFVVVGPPCFVY